MKTELPTRSMSSRRAQTAFTLLELLVVITIIGILAGFLVGLAPLASIRMKETRVRAELRQLETLIDAYKARYGIYPPDGMVFDPALNAFKGDPAKNPLFYELSGVLAYVPPSGASGYYYSPHRNETLLPLAAQNIFNRDGIVNAVAVHTNVTAANSGQLVTIEQRARLITHGFKDSQFTHYQQGPYEADLLVVGIPWPRSDKFPPLPAFPTVNPWRYVSTNPTNNPDSYDLWAEIVVGGKHRVIGNWKITQ